jgi:hypothetical protein
MQTYEILLVVIATLALLPLVGSVVVIARRVRDAHAAELAQAKELRPANA